MMLHTRIKIWLGITTYLEMRSIIKIFIPSSIFNCMLSFRCTVRRWSLHFNNIFVLCPRNLLSNGSQWSQTYPSMQGLGWELYNRTAGDESTPMKNDKIRFNSVTDSIDTPTQFITFHDAHTQKCTVRGWRLHFNNIFLLCPRTILSSWSQWSQTHPGLQGLGWELYNRTAGNESTLMKNDKIRLQFSDRFHRHTHTIHHIPWRSYTKVHCSGMASTLQQHFLTLPKNYSLQLITMVTNISWFAGSWLGTIQQDSREWKYPYEK